MTWSWRITGALLCLAFASCGSLEPWPDRYLKARRIPRFEPTAERFFDRARFYLDAGAYHLAIRNFKEARRLKPRCNTATGYFPAHGLAAATIALAEQTYDEAMSDVGATAERTTGRDMIAYRVNRALGLAGLAANHLDRDDAQCQSPDHMALRTRVRAFQARVRAYFTQGK